MDSSEESDKSNIEEYLEPDFGNEKQEGRRRLTIWDMERVCCNSLVFKTGLRIQNLESSNMERKNAQSNLLSLTLGTFR